MRLETGLPIVGLLMAGALGAGEVEYRLGIETEPTAYEFTVNNGGIRQGGQDEFAYHIGLVGGGLIAAPVDEAGRWAVLLGAECAVAEARDDWDGYLRWFEVRLVQGLAYRFSSRCEATFLLRGGAGIDRFKFSGSTAVGSASGTGQHDAIAVELGFAVRPIPQFAVFTGAGWRISRHRLHDDSSATDIDIDQSGPTLVLGLAWR